MLSLLLLPSVFLGFLVAGRLVGRVDKEKTRVLTLALCALSALLLTIKSSLALING